MRLQGVTVGYKGVPRAYQELHRATRGDSCLQGGYIGLQGVTGGYKGYRELQLVTNCHRE